ncbi:glycosyltransferase [Stappia sp. GBMRC 2046]|uniref:Glycosyltransferase n=1 Tax=Stappia sediminis TaxID=2692190 RepID=A0A7X3S9U2_9HYPH|nr:glycosyltransferase [Stappia sediminis]MXN67217.1 glycosyltransferase [Stappia sediminis]
MSPAKRAVLVLSAYHPSSEAVSSGPKIVASVIAGLERKGYLVSVVSFENELDWAHRPGGYVARGAPGSRVFKLTRTGRIIAGLLHPLLPFAASVRRYAARRHVQCVLAERDFAKIEVEFTQAMEALPHNLWPRARLVCHDVLTQLHERRLEHAQGLWKLFARFELFRIRRWEEKVLRSVGEVVTLNGKDKALIEAISGRSDVSVRYPEIASYVQPQERTSSTVEPASLLYWGHMGRTENVDAVLYFVAEILPRIKLHCPEVRLIVAGIDPPGAIRRLEGQDVEVTGFIENPADVFRRAGIGIVPLRLGAGLKIKTLELLASGLPVVSTSVGAEGVEPCARLRVADDPESFSAAVIEVIKEEGPLGLGKRS